MHKLPLVYVLTLNWNGKQLTLDCVESILKSDYSNYRVIVIDNGSTDGSVDSLKERFGNKIMILENESNLGYSGGFNVGLKYAFDDNEADYCLIMNNDTIIDKKNISELVSVAESDIKIGFTIGKVYYHDQPQIFQTVGKRSHPVRLGGGHIGNGEKDIGQYDEVEEREFCDDIYWLVRKELYQSTGGYDLTFFLQSEDKDWQLRAKKKGYKIMYTPFAKLWHKESMTLGKTSPLKAYYDARNPMLVVLIHASPKYFRRYFWLHFKKDIFIGSLVSIKHMKIAVAYNKWFGFLSGLLWGIKNKKLTFKHFL